MPINLDGCITGIFVPGNIGASSGLPPVVRVMPPRAPSTLSVQIHEVISATAVASVPGVIGATITETAAAVDSVYQARVFDLAVGEVAPATDAVLVHVPAVFAAAIAETVTTTETLSASIRYAAAVTETAAAADTPNATVVSAFTATTWNPSDKSANTTLSGSNLIATVSAAFSTASVRAVTGRSTGKYYWEVTFGPADNSGTNTGLAPASASFPLQVGSVNGSALITLTGETRVNGTSVSGSASIGGAGGTIRIAVDLGARLIWFQYGAGGSWNGSGSNDPATGVGGYSISGMTYPACPFFTGANSTTSQVGTAKFGASAFTYAVPSGFTAGWPV